MKKLNNKIYRFFLILLGIPLLFMAVEAPFIYAEDKLAQNETNWMEILPVESEKTLPKIPEMNLIGEANGVNGINLVFTPGTHGVLLENDNVLVGNVSVDLKPNMYFEAKLPFELIPKIRPDEGWEFIGWRIDIVPRIGYREHNWYDFYLENHTSDKDNMLKRPRSNEIYRISDLENLIFERQFKQVYRMTAEYKYSPQAPLSYVELVLLGGQNKHAKKEKMAPIVVTGEMQGKHIFPATVILAASLIAVVLIYLRKASDESR